MARTSPRLQRRKQQALQLLRQGSYPEAASRLTALCTKLPRDPDLYGALGRACTHLGRLDDAVASYRRAVKLLPRHWKPHADLAWALHLVGREEEAVDQGREAARIEPDRADLWDNLGIYLCAQGRIDEAIDHHRRALERDPGFYRARSNLLLTLHYQNEVDPAALLAEHRTWGERHTLPSPHPPHRNRPDPDRRLRVAYLSADLRTHSVAYFLEPILTHHDPEEIEVWCYSTRPGGDATTARLQDGGHRWRGLAGQPAEAIARQIHADRVDILVELGGHTSSEILRACSLGPAPVQVTYLGYPDTTGVPAIDYRLVDGTTDPPGSDRWATEELVRLPGCFLCYQPSPEAPEPAPLPAGRKGHVSFGSFNNLAKINEGVIALWAEVVLAVPGARLLVKNPSLDDPATRDRYARLFQEHGLSARQVELRGRLDRVADHLALYGEVDIALDTFPYNGTTTTCEALWQGVPVVTLAGTPHMARVGASLLQEAGLEEWVAERPQDYVATAVRWAADLDRLAHLRATLRERLRNFPLLDGDDFTRRLEATYRDLWRRWCTETTD